MGYTSEVIGDKPARAGLQNLGVPDTFEPDSERETATREAPRSSEQHCAAVLATAMDAIISLDQDHRIKLYNRAAEELFGYSAGRAIG
jgi:PAS domain-containing protein